MLPFVEEAIKSGFSVLILDPNVNTVEITTKKGEQERISIQGLESHQKHLLYVYNNIVSKSPAKKVVIVANRNAGVSVLKLLATKGHLE